METLRQNPDQLLKAIQNETSDEKRGRLKIFFGYAAGVGKTYAMLEAAHNAAERGIDVVSGYIEPHARPQTTALLEGLEQLPVIRVMHNGITLREFDIDGALKRKPQLILVDELAHTNAAGSRHVKRYQDIKELLNAGIDVYTTVNVQHIESLNDTVASITGIQVRERIPDSVFDQADQVELVDIEPAELLDRLASGNIYREDQAQRAAVNFFTVEKLTALREIALRRCAERVNLITENARIQNRGDYHTDEHILVCLSSSPSNAKIIRTAARMARAFRGSFTALFVETPAAAAMSEEDKKRLRENIRLAQQLGANIETSYGEDVPYQIAEYARLSGVSKIVIGRSNATRKNLFGKPTLTERLIANAPNLDVHVIPDASVSKLYREKRSGTAPVTAIPVQDVIRSIIVLLAATLIGYSFYSMGFSEANIVSVYIFGVLVISVITTQRFCGLISSVVSVLVFNFFFTVPRFTFHFNDTNYLVTFPIMFMVALLTGSLAIRLKDSARQSAHAAYRTKVLFETNQLLQKEKDEEGVARAAAGQLIKLMKRDIVIYLTDGKLLGAPCVFRTQDSEEGGESEMISEKEEAVAEWVLKNNKHAGATTDTFPGAKCYYLAIRVNQKVYGVVGIAMDEIPLDFFENSVLLSILGECALALENIKNAREKEEAAILARNEQLRANLLRAISHDLRTPLTSISGNADNLLANYEKMDDETRKRTFRDIYEDSEWLINLVENLLAVSRIEGNQVHLNRSVELMDEVITEAMRHINKRSREHTIRISSSEDIILVRIDARLIVQVIINLVDNAIKYTPAGSFIDISTRKEASRVIVSVSDNGPGIPDEQKPFVFDMFYSGANKIADSRRSLGLGLSLCRSIVTAHGGTISVSDNHPKGTVFTFTLPAGEVELHE
ncbi:MAG: sensor histidine kinase KdpD [Eubacteriales bacterium]|nr:sensor histidine kinase KdpD [Eubacteriales bacterium]